MLADQRLTHSLSPSGRGLFEQRSHNSYGWTDLFEYFDRFGYFGCNHNKSIHIGVKTRDETIAQQAEENIMNTAANVVDFGDRLPTPEEIDSAAEALTAIENQRTIDGAFPIGDAVLSRSLVDLLTDVLSVVARGDTISLVPLSRQLTTQEAADLLNVSRPFLVKLIDQEELKHVMVGTHRRLSLRDVLEYKARRSEGRKAALAEMESISEDLDGQ